MSEPIQLPPSLLGLNQRGTYEGQTISLDYFRWDGCKFIRCTVIYRGGPVQMNDCLVNKCSVRIDSELTQPFQREFVRTLLAMHGDAQQTVTAEVKQDVNFVRELAERVLKASPEADNLSATDAERLLALARKMEG